MGVRFPPPARCLILGSVTLLLLGCTPYYGEPPAASRTLAPGVLIHRVGQGETLWSISQKYDLEWKEIARANGIQDPSQVEVGQALKIPKGIVPLETKTVASPVSQLGRFVWPVRGTVVSLFGMRRRGMVNKGIDIQAPMGTQVMAARGGRVSFVHEALPGFGKTIILEHSGGFASVYAYVGEILVRQGEQVAQRQQIARVGATGRAEGPVLHFEIRRAQRPQNPLHYLP